jgi:Rap1a immunity proteins
VLINRRLLIAVVLTVVSFDAEASPSITGKELLADCSSNEGFRRTSCIGYVSGLGDGFTLWESSDADAPVCIPQHATAGQAQDIAVRYLRAHPEIRRQSAAILLRDAFKEAWPCPPKQAPR